jgi:hypothetical protein
MKLSRPLSLLVLVILVAGVPLAAFAQEEPKMEEFTSEDGLLTVLYPAEWFIQENTADSGFPGVTIGNSEETLASIVSPEGEELLPGYAGIVVMLMPVDVFSFVGVEVTDETTPDELAAIIVENFFEGGSSAESEATAETTEAATPRFGEVETVDLTEDLQAGYVPVTEIETEGALIVYQADGIVVLTLAAAHTGEYTEEIDALALAVASSVKYTGTADELMNILLGIGDTESPVEATAVVEPAG